MLAKQELVEQIRLGLAFVESYVRSGGPVNLLEINIHAEEFVGGLLNTIHGWQLVSTNNSKSNAECIDLYDSSSSIGIQVSSDVSAKKINQTLDCLWQHQATIKVLKLKCVCLLPKQSSYSIHSKFTKSLFDWKKDVLDFSGIVAYVVRNCDLALTTAVHRHIVESIPVLFASQRAMLTEQRKQIADGLKEFDRAVMWAAYQQEEPIAMYRAIADIRISLQKRGMIRISDKIISESFKKAHAILYECEVGVQNRFPELYKATDSSSSTKNVKRFKYTNPEYVDSIHYMMDIRSKLSPLLKAIQDKLDSIDKNLATLI